ncbi:MAG: hypothetical protein OXQ90_00190 [Gammaproteobacteria bacterium]|nr:hypothetical protein [Gammaproteobacteria bacterium]
MVRYYQAVHKRYLIWNRVTLWALVVIGTGSMATLWDKVPSGIQPVFGLVLAAMSLWVLFADYAAKSAIALSIAQQCGDIAIEWSNLFAKIDDPAGSVEEEQARNLLSDLERTLAHVTYRSGDAKLGHNNDVNRKSQLDAAKEMEMSHA